MARTKNSLVIAVDAVGTGKGDRFTSGLANLQAVKDTRQLIRFESAPLPPHSTMAFIREAIPCAMERAASAFRAVPGATIGLGFAPALYAWGGELWSLSSVYAADAEGLLFGALSKLPEEASDKMLDALAEAADEIVCREEPFVPRATRARQGRIRLARILCEAMMQREEDASKVPLSAK